MKKIEIGLVSLFSIAFILFLVNTPNSRYHLLLVFWIIYFFYTFISFWLFNDIKISEIFKSKGYEHTNISTIITSIVVSGACGVSTQGMIFFQYHLPGAAAFVLLGMLILSILTIISIIKLFGEQSRYYFKLISRTIPIIAIGILFLFYKRHFLLIRYREYPTYINAYKNLIANPENTELKEITDREFEKIDQSK